MPTPTKGPRMGGGPAHERLMLSNLATQLFEHGRITTTEAKAKRLRPYAEHLITFGKRGDLHARRQVLKRLNDKSVVHVLFAEIGPRYADRPGGYTRIVKLGPRKGDNAPMALIELVEALPAGQGVVREAEASRGTQFAASKAPTGATAESAADLASESPTAASVAASADIENAQTDLDAAQADVASGDTATAQADLDAARADIDAAQSDLDAASGGEAAADAQAEPEVAEAVEELAEAQEELSEAEQELAAARAQLAEAEAAAAQGSTTTDEDSK